MKGRGSKFPRKMEQAVAALLTARNIEEAAKAVNVSPKTLLRWQKNPEFDREYRQARRNGFRQAVARLQQAAAPAVTTLVKIIVDPAAPMAVKARCAFYILDQTRKAIEVDDLEERLSELERLTEATKRES